MPGDFELVLEGRMERELGETEAYRNRFGDTGVSVKHLLRKGGLQGETGASIAVECGVLLPEVHGEHGHGAACGGIVSQQFGAATLHLNAERSHNRDGSNGRLMRLIVEGRDAVLRPVMEIYTESDDRGGRANSALVGAIWQRGEDVAFDAGVRRARHQGESLAELRFGLTWAFHLHK